MKREDPLRQSSIARYVGLLLKGKMIMFKNPLLAVFLPVVCCLFAALSGVCAGDGSGLKFNGTSNRVDVGTALVSENITMSAWVKADTPWVNDTRVVVSNSYWGAAANRVGFHLMLQSNGTPASRYQTQADGVSVWSVTGTTNITGAWHHLTYVKEGTKISVVVDGKEEASRNDMPASITGLAILSQIRIGCNTSNARFFSGLIDEVRIWNHALTLAEIQESMSHELRGTEEGLVGYWKFNEGQGTTAFDSASNSHNGTLVGATWTTETAPITPGPVPLSAYGPSPANGVIDVPRDAVLSWKPGGYADTHDVYLGTVSADVDTASRIDPKGVLASQAQDANAYDPVGVLEFGKMYYWRVDEVNAPPSATIIKGAVWSFTTETLTNRVTAITATASSFDEGFGPENTINGSGLSNNLHSTANAAMWVSSKTDPQPAWIQYAFDRVYKLYEMRVWNYNVVFEPVLGFGFRDVAIEYSTDGTTWTVLKETQFARAPGQDNAAVSTTVDFAGTAAKFVRLTAKSNWGGIVPQFGLGEVRFYYIPVNPRQPVPASGAKGVNENTMLSWRAGREAASHQVYFGTDPNAVLGGTAPVQTVADHSFDPGPLEFGKTYYWKVAEVNEAATPKIWEGEVWSFSTRESFVVDDFESYTDIEGSRIYETWVDGWTNSTGSTVGYIQAPFAERTILHGGKQSMPLDYNNTKSPFYSEAERTFDTPQDWTVNGADTLTLYFQGNPAAFAEAAGTITMSGSGTDIWNTADQFRFACQPLTGDGTLVAKVESVGNTDPWAKAGVMIRESLEPGSRFAAVYATPGNGVRFQARMLNGGSGSSDTSVATPEQIALKTPVWIKVERKGSSFSCFYSTDGVKWTTMSWNPQTINMTAGAVYIGLAVTSHNATATTTAVFSNVATTGNVTGSWQVQAIGVAQPANDAAPLYVVVQDSAGKSKAITHPDPAATTLATWQAWRIPLSDLGGVKLTAVKKMIIGVGDRSNPKADGAGKVFIDDIGVGHPVPAN
jgi:hypothetical protein